jgi:hypothetical protein
MFGEIKGEAPGFTAISVSSIGRLAEEVIHTLLAQLRGSVEECFVQCLR